jgi:uncharacterized RDD family membrane protein YckC
MSQAAQSEYPEPSGYPEQPGGIAEEATLAANGTEGPGSAMALRQMAAERLAAHRTRRAARMQPATPAAAAPAPLPPPPTAEALRQEAVRAATRARREAAAPEQPGLYAPSGATPSAPARSGGPRQRPSVRDAVMARYEQTPSYQEFLAAEAERALEKARAEAEVAARNAAAVEAAQRQLLAELDQWKHPAPDLFEPIPQPLFLVEDKRPPVEAPRPQSATPREKLRHPQPADLPAASDPLFAEPDAAPSPTTASASLFAALDSALDSALNAAIDDRHTAAPIAAAPPAERRASARPQVPAAPLQEAQPAPELTIQPYTALPPVPRQMPPMALVDAPRLDPAEIAELEEEIAFRFAPEFEDLTLDMQPIEPNIIEFPRELVAARKARPRLAEGPLRDEVDAPPQMSIFDVEPAHVAEPAAMQAYESAPEWQSLYLSATPAFAPGHTLDGLAELDAESALSAAASALPQLYPAPIDRRVMAALVDFAAVGAGFVIFSAVAAKLCGPALADLPRPALLTAAAIAFVVLAALYQALFFTLNESTPGMDYARIGLCTFDDRNPTRRELRRRMGYALVAICPAGLGLLWTLLDARRLGWHDRLSRMYPRAY